MKFIISNKMILIEEIDKNYSKIKKRLHEQKYIMTIFNMLKNGNLVQKWKF